MKTFELIAGLPPILIGQLLAAASRAAMLLAYREILPWENTTPMPDLVSMSDVCCWNEAVS